MVRIQEYQYETKNLTNYQKRIVEFSSWEEYVQDLRMKHNSLKTFPMEIKFLEIHEQNEKIQIIFWNSNLRKRFTHQAILLKY